MATEAPPILQGPNRSGTSKAPEELGSAAQKTQAHIDSQTEPYPPPGLNSVVQQAQEGVEVGLEQEFYLCRTLPILRTLKSP